MKNKLVIIGVAVIALATVMFPSIASAQMPVYGDQVLGTSVFVGSTASNVNYIIDCRKQSSVSIGLINQQSTSDTSAQTIAYSRGNDGINFGTTLSTAAFTPIASSKSVQFTNLPTLGCGYIKINYVTNAAAGSIIATNTLDYAIKINAP